MSELEVLFPQGKEISLTGEIFTIKPFKLGQIPLVAGVLSAATGPAQEAVFKGLQNDPSALLKVFATLGPDLISLLAKLINRPIAFVEELEQDEAVILLQSVIEVNKDFFSKRVTPLLSKK